MNISIRDAPASSGTAQISLLIENHTNNTVVPFAIGAELWRYMASPTAAAPQLAT